MNQTALTLLRVIAVLIALGLTILLGIQGYVDWQGTERDPDANGASKMLSFVSMVARIAIGLILVAAAAFLGRRTRPARAPAP